MSIYSPYTDWYTAGYDAYYSGRQAPIGLQASESKDWDRGYADAYYEDNPEDFDAYHDYNDFGDYDDSED